MSMSSSSSSLPSPAAMSESSVSSGTIFFSCSSGSTGDAEPAAPEDFPETTHCGICYEFLVILSEDSSEGSPSLDSEESSGPDDSPTEVVVQRDDVEVPCHGAIDGLNHHFHWECLIQANESGGWGGQTCPSDGCGGDPLNEEGRLVVNVRNDSDTVEDFDLTEVLDDEGEMSLERKREMYVVIQFIFMALYFVVLISAAERCLRLRRKVTLRMWRLCSSSAQIQMQL